MLSSFVFLSFRCAPWGPFFCQRSKAASQLLPRNRALGLYSCMDPDRSTLRITRTDLKRLARIAEEDRADYFSRHPEFAILYSRRLLCTALAGDAALHYLNGMTGVGAFELWSFYAEHPEAGLPVQRARRADFGASRFGRAADAPDTYAGRRVDLNGRSIDCPPGTDPVAALQRYLRAAATPSARELARKALVLIAPEPLLGVEVWPTLALSGGR
jgi:hypothetical protein